jgi:hypothetical protein
MSDAAVAEEVYDGVEGEAAQTSKSFLFEVDNEPRRCTVGNTDSDDPNATSAGKRLILM